MNYLYVGWKEAALLPIGQLIKSIKATPREQPVTEPPENALFDTALLLQAGLRVLALLPEERKKTAFPPKSFPDDPQELKIARNNLADVLVSEQKEATEQQISIAMDSVSSAITQLVKQGYADYADAVLMSQTGWTDKRESCRLEKTRPSSLLKKADLK